MNKLLVIVVTALFFALTHASAPDEFSTSDLYALACLFPFVIGAQLLIAHFLIRSRFLQNLFLTASATANIFSVNLILNDAYTDLPHFVWLLTVLLAVFILFSIMNMMDDYPRVAKVILIIVTSAVIGIVAEALIFSGKPPDAATGPGRTSAKNIRLVDFKTRPNVYFISFDALMPKVLVHKFFGLEKTPYHDILDAHLRRFKNMFADKASTIGSLNSLLAFDLDYYNSLGKKKNERHLFSGRKPSPLLEIFKHNGYTTNTLFQRPYFGDKKGPYVDNYFTERGDGVCEFVNEEFKKFIFLGYCRLKTTRIFTSLLTRLSLSNQRSEMEFLLAKLQSGLDKGKPQMFMAYIFSPGHTPKSFNWKKPETVEKFRLTYLRNSSTAAEYLDQLITFIFREDPSAILFVYGDHGAFITRGAKMKDNDITLHIHGRSGIYGGIYPPDRCAESFAKPYTEGFMTVMQGAHMIIRCLAGGENAFIAPINYKLGHFGTGSSHRYEDHLYE
ncbi:MAG: hypothetical protein QF375_03085 [Arenicellales bacterium]|jgi:hypothetical protein|nr:hypothetical protein [Arenicellales bacterium]|tara:strand:+ start:1659 stop:3164 length:1506 start_codon:yes stop_codon:yes gene_type:complete